MNPFGVAPTYPTNVDRVLANSNVQQKEKTTTDISDPLAQKEVFLQLLVKQIQNQNPLDPMNSDQFLTQLSQFTQVEKTLEMSENLKAIREALAPTGPTAEQP
jgi:flagellar basal-body rod modification protein FlgD